MYRATQYFARFFAWYLISRGHKVDAVSWNALKSHLALARKRALPLSNRESPVMADTSLSFAPRQAVGTPAGRPSCSANHG